ncbi:MAG: hypothetical protein QOH29_1168, partial [Actinomycetota bacterium]|nr:hypothetical protein [Actinomycetota bacterium]
CTTAQLASAGLGEDGAPEPQP